MSERKKYFTVVKGVRLGFTELKYLLAMSGDHTVTNNRGRVLAEFWGL